MKFCSPPKPLTPESDGVVPGPYCFSLYLQTILDCSIKEYNNATYRYLILIRTITLHTLDCIVSEWCPSKVNVAGIMANENDFHNNRPPSRRGRNLHPSRYVALETRRSGGEEEDNMDEYESLNFDRTTPPKNVRRTTTIPIPELKSSSCSSLSFAFCRQEGTGVRKREFSATESPLAQAQRLQDQGASANNSYSHRHRFLQSGLATTMDQVHKATEPYAATKNKGKISRASQSRSVDVLASALLETKKPKPRNTIDLCEDDDDDDEHGENGNGVDHTHTHEHEVSSDLGDALQQSPNDAPGYIKALKHSKVHSPTIQGEYKNPRQRLPLDSSFTSPLMLDSPHTLTVPGMHSHPGDTNRCSSSPQNSRDSRKRSREGHRDTQTDNHIERPKVDFSNTPHSNSKVSCIKEASVAILASATRSATTIALQDSENSDDEPQRLFKKHKVGIWGKASSLIGQLLSPNTKKRKRRKKHKDRKIEYCEGTPTDQLPDDLRPTIQSDRTSSDDQINCTQDKSAAMRQMAEALEDEDDWIHHNPKEQRHAIQAGEKPWPPQVKKKDQEQLSEVLEEQDDWIHHNPKVQQPVNQTENEPWTPQAKKKNHEPMAEALEDDDDWSHRKPKAERPVIQSENEPSIPQVQRKDHEPEHKRGFHLSKANNNVKVVSSM